MSTVLPPLASRRAAVNVFGSSSASAGSTVACAPSSSASARFSGLDAVAMTRPAPQRRASWTARRPDAAGAGDDDDRLALGQVRAGAQQVPGGRALEDDGQRLLVGDAVGHRPGEEVVRDDLLGVPRPAGLGDVDDVQDLGTAEAGDLHGSHARQARAQPFVDRYGDQGGQGARSASGAPVRRRRQRPDRVVGPRSPPAGRARRETFRMPPRRRR